VFISYKLQNKVAEVFSTALYIGLHITVASAHVVEKC